VAVQQIFSLLMQSPTGALRLQPLAETFAGLLSPADLEAILGHLHGTRYLTTARAGEWRAGERLKRLVDLQASEHAPLSIYSNLQTPTGQIQLRDQQSQQVVATVDPLWLDREVLTLEGRPLDVGWFDGEALWVTAHRGAVQAERLPYLSARQLLSFELAQQLSAQLSLSPGTAPIVATPAGWLLFHWLGDVYGQALVDLLGPTLAVEASAQPGLCLLLREAPRTLPSPAPESVARYLHEHYHQLERLLALGAYQPLLPPELRRSAVVEQFGVERFVAAVAQLRPSLAPESATIDLLRLLGPGSAAKNDPSREDL
jgi:hypothetical protein